MYVCVCEYRTRVFSKLTSMAIALGRSLHIEIGVSIGLVGSVRIRRADVKSVAEISELRMSDVEVEVEVDERIGGSIFRHRNFPSGQLVQSANDLWSRLVL